MLYAIGDIHGHYWKLVSLMNQLPLKPQDRLVFVGDYIDRGPASREVIDFLIELRRERPSTVFLRGNHEQMMLDAKASHLARQRRFPAQDEMVLWIGNGGSETLDSYPPRRPWYERVPEEHWSFIEESRMEHVEDGYRFVHAGYLPDGARWPYEQDPRLWVREEFIESEIDFDGLVIFGHTPQRHGRTLVMRNKIGIDTGAAYGGPLTAIGLAGEGVADFTLYQA
jgi:serine/threonine protein phosphatase 1